MLWMMRLYFLLLASVSFAKIHNKSWWNNTIFYQIYVRSFYDSDVDGIGDLKEITSKLDYIAETGINAIWLSPIYTSPMIDFGYDISDSVDIDPICGSLEDFKVLLAHAKKLGLKVVLDFIPSHTSDKHIWFQKALQGDEKYKNYYIWAEGRNNDDKTPPNNWISVFDSSAWTYVKSQKQWYLHQFEYRQPNLNFSNPEVRKEMLIVLKFWLDLGVDGFRVDLGSFIYENPELRNEPRSNVDGATSREHKYLKHIYIMDGIMDNCTLFAEWQEFLDSYVSKRNQDQKLMLMEVYTDLKHAMQYYNYDLLPFNFRLIINVKKISSAQKFKQQIDLWMNSMSRDKIASWAMENDDNSRVASRYPDRSVQMTMLSMILPGFAVIYNDEIGLVDKRNISWKDTQYPQGYIADKKNFKSTSRDPVLTPFQWNATEHAGSSTANFTWLPSYQIYKKMDLENQIAADKPHYKIYKTLAHMRRTELALTEGSYKSITANNDTVVAIIRNNLRNNHSCAVVLLINFSDDEQVVDLSQEEPSLKLRVKVSSSKVTYGKLVDVKKIPLSAKATVVYMSI